MGSRGTIVVSVRSEGHLTKFDGFSTRSRGLEEGVKLGPKSHSLGFTHTNTLVEVSDELLEFRPIEPLAPHAVVRVGCLVNLLRHEEGQVLSPICDVGSVRSTH